MSIMYNGSHSVTFVQGEANSSYTVKRSWLDFHLIPEKVPVMMTRTPKPLLVDVPFSSKTLDYTDEIAKGLFYEPTSGEWFFYVDHDQWSNWYTAKTQIENFINGKALWCVLEDDHNYKYSGRFLISEWEDGSDYSKITITYSIDGIRMANDFVYDV